MLPMALLMLRLHQQSAILFTPQALAWTKLFIICIKYSVCVWSETVYWKTGVCSLPRYELQFGFGHLRHCPCLISNFSIKLTIAVAGWLGSSSANRWHVLSVTLPLLRATKPNSLQHLCKSIPHRTQLNARQQNINWFSALCIAVICCSNFIKRQKDPTKPRSWNWSTESIVWRWESSPVISQYHESII